ncbi:hypothetical protein SAMN06265795_102188 [Noviherbaspirillum humi]|uniref:SMODS and SLOG-associating 2TM effector domain-containing protein n=1 Tax=Noviherbaspirillum humi TaxID=1688639 RepID=A0A239DIN8_9BURK|nr:SLATT domain-containing protein [Noviherbaspirillum humi]SNS31812.1 hypothetical protein SAMN06265795_102188 [Noviherbaspirillum humi]
MDKQALLKLIAESSYNIGFGAKKHFATFDIVEKVPGWIGLASLTAGVLALFIKELEEKYVTAAFTILGIAALTFNSYNEKKDQYNQTGIALTGKFHELRSLYQTVKSLTATVGLTPYLAEHSRIQQEALQFGMSKHIFLSDWYAHIKFFGQSQTDWMDEQLHFGFIKDKIPFSAKVLFVAISILVAALYLPNAVAYLKNFCG